MKQKKTLIALPILFFALGFLLGSVSYGYNLLDCEWNDYNVKNLKYWIASDVESDAGFDYMIFWSSSQEWNDVVKSDVPNFYEVDVQSDAVIWIRTFYEEPPPSGRPRCGSTQVIFLGGEIVHCNVYINTWCQGNNYWQDSHHKEWCSSHEFGHCLGLEHVSAWQPLMYWQDNHQETRRYTPQSDDINGVYAMYHNVP